MSHRGGLLCCISPHRDASQPIHVGPMARRGGGAQHLPQCLYQCELYGGMRQARGSLRGEGISVAYRCRAAASVLVSYPLVIFALRSFVTERHLRSLRPLTSHFLPALCADRLLCAHAQ